MACALKPNSTSLYLTTLTELRKLPRQNITELGHMLQIGFGWKDIMGLIPGSPWVPEQNLPDGTNYIKKYTAEEISLVAAESMRDGRTGFEILIEEWGTSGKIRPKIKDLIALLIKAGFERSSTYLKNLIKDNEVEEESQISGIIHELDEQMGICNNKNMSLDTDKNNEIDTQLKNVTIPKVVYSDIIQAVKKGINIGEGAFGAVYKSNLVINNQPKIVAIKLLINSDNHPSHLVKKENLFINEVKILSECNHKNLIKLEAYSYLHTNLALIYSYMENGSLFDRLACINGTLPLKWKLRLDIGEGAANGIVYLHTNFVPPMVHRDIKSANILLDRNFVPKLGDFGIVRAGGKGIHTNTSVNTTAIGTQMYMAPEAFRGDISVKMDTFSYAIVMLELLTGLPFYDEERENRDILSHVQEYEGEVMTLLDPSAGEWDKDIALELFDFTEVCTRDKKDRPNMVQALTILQNIIHKK